MKRFCIIPNLLLLAFSLCCFPLTISAENSQQITMTEGNNFFVTWLMNGASTSKDPNLKLTLIASARQAMAIVVEYGDGTNAKYNIPANGSTTIDITPNKAYIGESEVESTKIKKGVRVYSTDKKKRFTLVAANKSGDADKGNTSFDATLVIPTEGLGNEYMVQTHEVDRINSEFAIVGTEDNTQVTIHLANGTTEHPSGGQVDVTLGAKEVWLANSKDGTIDLSGTTICSNKPVAVFNGHKGTIIPVEESLSEDHVYEQALPVERWGKEFIVPMFGGNLKTAFVEITAAYDNTTITIAGGDPELIDSNITLNHGDTYRGVLETGQLHIQASQPIIVFLYSTSAAYNKYKLKLLGDPSSTMVNSIEQFVDTTIYTPYINIETDESAPLSHYITLVTRDPSEMKIDGNVIAGDFQLVSGTNYYYSTQQVDKTTHVLTNPNGFVGYAYGLTAGQIYIHSVGYKCVPYKDSLFVKTEGVMSASYDLPWMDGQGYYQRQWNEWPANKGRWDTVHICDSSIVDFMGQLSMNYIPRTLLQWEVFKMKNGKRGSSVHKETKTSGIADQNDWKYQFIIEPQKNIEPDKRSPFEDFMVDCQVSRNRAICENLQPIKDTVHTIVRVYRVYNDTTKKVVCIGDTLRFFKDTGEPDEAGFYNRGIGEDSTSFIEEAAKTKFEKQYKLGEWQLYIRRYNSVARCDSMAILKLFVCDTAHTVLYDTICENNELTYPDKFIGTTFSYEPNTDKVYFDTLKTKGCECMKEVPDFEGCDSIIELHLHVCPMYKDTMVDTVCTNGDYTLPYTWNWKDGTYLKDINLTAGNEGKTTYYSDTLRTKGCNCNKGGCDSIFVLQLYVPPFTHITTTQRFCDAEYDKTTHSATYKDKTIITDPTTGIWPNHDERLIWDVNNNTRISVDDIINMSGGTTNTFIDSMTTIYGCDSIYTLTLTKDTISVNVDRQNIPNNATTTWHGKTYGPFPSATEGTQYIYYDDNATTTKAGCDSIWRLELTISESFYQEFGDTICDDNGPYTWEGHKCGHATDTILTNLTAGTYEIYDNMKTIGRPVECDSIWKLILKVNKTYNEYDTIHLCDQEIKEWNGFKYAGPKASAGTYRKRFADPDGKCSFYEADDEEMFQTKAGCDSMCHVHFVIHRTYLFTDPEVTICANENYIWDGHSNKGRKLYDKTTGKSITFGKGKLWNNSTNATFELVDSIKTSTCKECLGHGCDSIYTIKLTVHPVYGPTVIDTTYCINNGMPFKWQPDKNKPSYIRTFTRDTTACFDTLKTKGCNCDSIFELRLHLYDNTPKSYDTIVCQSANAFIMGTTGITFTPQDSTVGKHTIVKTVYDDEALGCPYVETWKVTVKPTYPTITYKDTVCQGENGSKWEWTSHSGTRTIWDAKQKKRISGANIPINKIGTFTFVDSLKTKTADYCDCDSIETLQLVVVPSYTANINKKQIKSTGTICDNDSISWRGMLFVGDKYKEFHKTYNKNLYPKGVITLAAGKYNYGDTVFDKTALSKRSANLDCDSLTFYAYTLTVKATSDTTIYISSCDNKDVWYKNLNNGQGGNLPRKHVTTITKNDFYDTIPAKNSCDSVIHLIYTIYPTYAIETTIDICSDSNFVWQGHTNSGRKIYDKATGKAITFGKGKLWNNNTNATFELVDSIKTNTCKECSKQGCDSIHTLKLRVHPVYGPTVIDTTYCMNNGMPFKWRPDKNKPSFVREFYRDTTACYDTLKTKGCNCDSIFELRLHLYDNTPRNYDTIVCQSANAFIMGTTGITFTPQDSTVGKHTIVKTIYDEEALGCPYVETWKVMVRPVYPTITYNDTVCQGENGSKWEWTSPDGTRTIWDAKQKKQISGANIPINKIGTFTFVDSLKTKTADYCDCDSIETLQLVVVPSYTANINKKAFQHYGTICDNDSISWRGRLFVGDKYKEFHKTYNKNLYPKGVITLAAGTYNYGDTVFDKTALSKRSANFDCDSLSFYAYTITVKATSDTTLYESSCDNKDVWYKNLNNGQGGNLPRKHVTTTTKVDIYDTIPAQNSCDSVIHLVYTIFPTYYHELKDTLCSDSSYVWNKSDFTNGHVYINGKRTNKLSTALPTGINADTLVYIDSLHTVNGCDSIEVLKLFVTRSFAIVDNLKISSEGSLTWQGKTYIGEYYKGSYDKNKVTVVRANIKDTAYYSTHRSDGISCDSIYYLHLNYGKVFRDTVYDFVCDNCTYDWHLTSPITGKDVIAATNIKVAAGKDTLVYHKCKTEMDYDSIYVLVLKGYPTYHFETSDSLCQGTDGTWIGHENSKVLYQDGKHISEISTKQYGWTTIVDSLETHTKFIDPNGVNTRTSACDSIWIRRLYIYPTYDEEFNREKVTDKLYVCSNATIIWDSILYVGRDYDSITHPITYPPMEGLAYKEVIHAKDVSTSYETLYNRHFYQTTMGCDSIQFLELNMYPSPIVIIHDTIGDDNSTWEFGHGANYHHGSEFHVKNYTDTARVPYTKFFIDTVSNIHGCDSIIWDSLVVLPTFYYVLDTAICGNVRFDWRRWTELNHTYSQTIRDTVVSKFGSNEVYILNLTLIPAYQEEARIGMCKNDTLHWHYTTIKYDPIFKDAEMEYWARYERDNSCDSTFHLHVQYYNYYHFDKPGQMTEVTICQYDDWRWYEKDGTEHTKALRDEKGNKWSYIPTDTTGLIVFYDSLHTSSPCHCDSTFVLRLYVKPAFRDFSDTAHVICSNDSVYWGQTNRYYKSKWAGDVYDTARYVNQWGCDSLYYFHMKVKQAYDSLLVDTVCADEPEYTWQYTSYLDKLKEVWTAENESTIYDVRNYTAINGCDSIYRLQLTIRPISIEEWSDTICQGESRNFNGRILTTTGTYRDTLTNKWGCRDYQTFHLEVVPPTIVTLGKPKICGDDNEFDVPFTYEGGTPIAYSIVYDNMAIAQGFESEYDIYIPNGETSITLTMPYHANPKAYTRPDSYSARLYFDNGICEDTVLQRVIFRFETMYPSWVIEQHWNDQIAILIPALNGGYEFSDYQWYRNDTMMIGETKSYLYQPHWLDANSQYSVALTRQGDSIAYRTCPITPQLRPSDPLSPTMPYISVVPTVVVKDNPVVNILSINQGTYKIYNATGKIIGSGQINPDEHHAMEVRLPGTSGIYVFYLSESSGLKRSVKVLVE